MALVFADGIDGYNSGTAQIRAGWSSGPVTGATGRFAGNANRLSLFNGARAFVTTPEFKINANDLRLAFYARGGSSIGIDSATGANFIYLFHLRDPTSSYGIKFTLRSGDAIPQIGFLDAFNNNFSPAFNVNTGVAYSLFDFQWHHYEMRFVAANTATGLVQLWIDGQQVMNYQNVVTVNNANSIANSHNVMNITHMITSWPGAGSLFGDYYAYWDDLIIWDGVGSEMNAATRLGPHRIRSLFPRANGTYRDFKGFANTGGNWNALRSVDDDTSFAEANNSQQKESFPIDIIPGTPQRIPAITIRTHTKNPDIGEKKFSLFLDSGPVEVNANSTILTAPLFYQYTPNSVYPIVYHSDPNGNVAWTSANLANIEVGIKVEN